jgi:hypothetical protein
MTLHIEGIEIFRLGGALPELIGTFVVGIPQKSD